jgi:hypothetical protein
MGRDPPAPADRDRYRTRVPARGVLVVQPVCTRNRELSRVDPCSIDPGRLDPRSLDPGSNSWRSIT